MSKPSTLAMSRPVTSGHAMSLTEQNRTGQNSLPTRERKGYLGLREYLAAPELIQQAFDSQVKRRLDADLALDRWAEWEAATDPLAARVARNRENLSAALGLEQPTTTVNVTWDERWAKRAKRPPTQTYDRATDPLLDLDLREAWPRLTGEDVPGYGRVTCPHPDHADLRPDCQVFHDGWRCYGCNRYGDLIDLGGFLYGITPRGSDFFRIRERLMAEMGMEVAA